MAETSADNFGQLYDAWFARIYNYARLRAGSACAADDIASAVFEKTLAGLDSYKPQSGPFGAWIFAIARNTVNDHYRKSWRTVFGLELFENLPAGEPGPDAQAAALDDKRRLLSAMAKLDAREREVLALKFSADLTNRDIAAITGLSESNTAVIIFRALKQLKAELEPDNVL